MAEMARPGKADHVRVLPSPSSRAVCFSHGQWS